MTPLGDAVNITGDILNGMRERAGLSSDWRGLAEYTAQEGTPVCTECGADFPAEGQAVCSECLYNADPAPELVGPAEGETCDPCEAMAASLREQVRLRHTAEVRVTAAEYEADVSREAAYVAREDRARAWERGWLAAMGAVGHGSARSAYVMPPNPYANGGH